MMNKLSQGKFTDRQIYPDRSKWENHILEKPVGLGWTMISGMSLVGRGIWGEEDSQEHGCGGRRVQNPCAHVRICI